MKRKEKRTYIRNDYIVIFKPLMCYYKQKLKKKIKKKTDKIIKKKLKS